MSYLSRLNNIANLTKTIDTVKNKLSDQHTTLIKVIQEQLINAKVPEFCQTRTVVSQDGRYEMTVDFIWDGTKFLHGFDGETPKPLLSETREVRDYFVSHLESFLSQLELSLETQLSKLDTRLSVRDFHNTLTIEEYLKFAHHDLEGEEVEEMSERQIDEMMMDGIED